MRRDHPGFNDVAKELAKQKKISLAKAKSQLADRSPEAPAETGAHSQALSQPRPPSYGGK